MEKNTPGVFRIDEKVYYTMGFISMAFLLLLIYSYKTRQPCEPVNIIFPDSELFTGAVISLKADTKNGEGCVWDFGDKSRVIANTPFASHVYTSPGVYQVSLIVNGTCRNRQNIIISERPVSSVAGKPDLTPGFTYPAKVRVNQPVTFMDTTHGALSREWFFEEGAGASDTGRKASWIFTTAGLQTVYLRINGRPDMTCTRKIMVTDPEKIEFRKRNKPGELIAQPVYIPYKPSTDTVEKSVAPAPAPAPEIRKTAPDIQAEEMETLLLEVVTGAKTADYFSRYFCDNPSVAVEYNTEKISFADMCGRLKAYKSANNIKRPVVSLTKNRITGCVLSIKVSIVRKSILAKIKGWISPE